MLDSTIARTKYLQPASQSWVQRYGGLDEFQWYFDGAGQITIEHTAGTVLVTRKRA